MVKGAADRGEKAALTLVFRRRRRRGEPGRAGEDVLLRIIGGSCRGAKLAALAGLTTRPTADKVRGAIFNILFDVADAEVLDLFGGSGAMGLEALSRGARRAVIVEKDDAAFATIEKNIASLSCGDGAEGRHADFRSALRPGERFDIIFLDPPYRSGLLPQALAFIAEAGLLNDDGVVVAETAADQPFVPEATTWQTVKEKKYGKTKIYFLKM